MYVWGGQGEGGTLLNDMHALRLDTLEWSRVECGGTVPSARYGHTIVVHGDRAILFGAWRCTARVADGSQCAQAETMAMQH